MKNDAVLALVERKMQQIHGRQDELIREWEPYIAACESWMQESRDRSLEPFEKRNIAQCL